MLKKFYFLLIAATFISCSSFLPTSKKAEYELLLNPENASELHEDELWERLGLKSSFALGKYQVNALPLVNKTNLEGTCFKVKIKVNTQDPSEASLKNFEVMLEDRNANLYALRWLEKYYDDSLLKGIERSGATGTEMQWSNQGILCAYTKIQLDDYFEVSIAPLGTHFPFYGTQAKLSWDFHGVQFPKDHPSYKEPRKREVQRYKGW